VLIGIGVVLLIVCIIDFIIVASPGKAYQMTGKVDQKTHTLLLQWLGLPVWLDYIAVGVGTILFIIAAITSRTRLIY
jgi:hypothetical protein